MNIIYPNLTWDDYIQHYALWLGHFYFFFIPHPSSLIHAAKAFVHPSEARNLTCPN